MAAETSDVLASRDTAAKGSKAPTAVRVWLWIVAAMILAMVVVGGATRLTESGLSITEWKPISGVIPPLSPQAWEAEFAKYKAIPQYAAVHPDIDLAGFKSIFYWEWAHRLLGRLIGAVVALPLAGFWLAGMLSRSLKIKLVGLLALGGLQGVIGWWMVSSGLSERTEVSQYRLAVHLVTAALTLALAIGFAETLEPPSARPAPRDGERRLRATASLLVGGVFLQLVLGALVAGLRAGRIYNTWPLMGDRLVPSPGELLPITPLWRNLFETATTAQFDHRLVAYLLLLVAVAHAIDAWRTAPGGRVALGATVLALAVLAQGSIGIATLLWSVPLGAALLHQGCAMLVLAVAVTHRCGLRPAGAAWHGTIADPAAEVIGYGFAPSFQVGRR